MSKHKPVGDDKEKVGKRGSPPSAAKSEKRRKASDDKQSLPKVGKQDVGRSRRNKALH